MSRRYSDLLYTFEPQPDFPTEDISGRNAAMASHYLETDEGSRFYQETLQGSLRVLHEVGNSALMVAQLAPDNNQAEYQAFCHGFADIDYIATLLGSRQHVQIMSGLGMQVFYTRHGEMADIELAERRQNWLETHQTTLDIIFEASKRRRETDKQFTARTIGAQVASEILYAAA